MDQTIRFEKIKELLVTSLDQENYDLELLNKNIKGDTEFLGEIRIDSLNFLEFFMRLEEEFNITIGEDKYTKLTSIDKIIIYLNTLEI